MGDTTYVPSISVQNMTRVEGPNASGSGSPEGVIYGFPGYTYVDTDTGDLYVKTSGYGDNEGWVEASSGGGGTTQVATGSGAPSGAPAAGIVLYVDTDSGTLYVWNGSAWL